MSGQANLHLMRQSQSESEQFWALLIVEENPAGKTTKHPSRVKVIPMCSMESNPGRSLARDTIINKYPPIIQREVGLFIIIS